MSIRRLACAAAALSLSALAALPGLAAGADPLAPTGRWTANTVGSAATPPMGWNSWNAFRTEINEEKVVGSAYALVSTGLAKKGYRYVNIDDGWWLKRRQSDGRLEIRTAIFPSARIDGQKETSFRPFVDRLHRLGLKAGIYTDIGRNACSQAWDADSPNLPEGSIRERQVGLEDHVDQDIRLFFQDWGFDYVKIDACGLADFGPVSRFVRSGQYAARDLLIVRPQPGQDKSSAIRRMYEQVAQAIAKYRPANDFFLSICTWGRGDVREWGHKVGNAWRTSPDIHATWDSMLRSYDSVAVRALYARPGAWNDPDMLFIGKGDFDANHLVEARSHFTLWAMMNSPLLIGYDLRGAPQSLLDIWGNTDLIAVNQDPLGNQGVVVQRTEDVQIIVKTLSGDRKAVALFNRSGRPQTVTLSAAHLKYDPAAAISLRDLWRNSTRPAFKGEVSLDLAPRETLVFEARGRRTLKNGAYLSENPARLHVAVDGTDVAQMTADTDVYGGAGGAQADASPYSTPLAVGRATFRSGVGVLANSRIEVRTQRSYRRFQAAVGVDQASRNRSANAQVYVYGDGRLLAKSKPFKAGDAPADVDVDIGGVRTLELVTRSEAPAADPVAVTWGDARLLN